MQFQVYENWIKFCIFLKFKKNYKTNIAFTLTLQQGKFISLYSLGRVIAHYAMWAVNFVLVRNRTPNPRTFAFEAKSLAIVLPRDRIFILIFGSNGKSWRFHISIFISEDFYFLAFWKTWSNLIRLASH